MKSNDIQTAHAELDGIGSGLVKRLNKVNDKPFRSFLTFLCRISLTALNMVGQLGSLVEGVVEARA